jgi:hypothetical protein
VSDFVLRNRLMPEPAAPAAPVPDPANLQAATRDMGLTPQEQFLYQTHLDNLYGPGKVVHPDGAISTLYQMSFDRNGRTYNIPTVWGGAIIPPAEAIQQADKLGLDRFPSYASGDEAERRYNAMHGYMERDTATYRNTRGAR